MIRLGITGTDTGVGKTFVACALAAALRKRGLNIAAMKPVETGVEFNDSKRDGALLARAAGVERPLSDVAPITLRTPLAPPIAAERERRTIDLDFLDRAVDKVGFGADALIVEGAGGLLVPVVGSIAFDELFKRWSLDVIVVAANRLGAINHTRLTLAAARSAELRVRAVVLNRVTPMADESADSNAAAIATLERVPVVELPWLGAPGDLDRAPDQIERTGLLELIGATTAVVSN